MNLVSRCSMNLIKIGHVSNTHGLKGEIRILSNFKFKDNVFKVSNKLYISFSFII